ncbi:hypothetical protein SKAU_G00195380 [Synaphobranchus kaupii]|uniref:ribonuclease H n=1 Tax=Synaphobranchus kaupii TaxID=118154 RepID=A0A9Q1FEI4_SYNKA|nr:hypothetical protein SKAU_G00195380 [Synaphobranchus kaupii]
MDGAAAAIMPQLASPGRFDFTNVNEWPRWMKRFEHYRIASGLDKQSEEFQVNAFMYAAGDDAEDILNVLPLTEAQKKSYKSVTDAFNAHCISKRNIIFERARFNRRNQEPDTGAAVTAIPSSTFSIKRHGTLQSPGKVLYDPGNHRLDVKGCFKGKLCIKETTTEQDIYVVAGLSKPLLGLPAIEALTLIQRLHTVQAQQESVKAQYPTVFSGLGKLKEPYKIELESGAVPYALSAPRRVPLPLRDKVRAELTRMEDMGVISKVTQPTPWCAGMVVVPKAQSPGKIRLCVDLTQLNQWVRRERHILPAVDHTLAMLAGAKVFTKLDATSGFWQIPLSEESSLLTTFITPFGRYAFNRLPFGISSAPEHFQRRMSQMLEGCPGIVCHADDILVYGEDEQQHDENLQQVLETLREEGLTLNEGKCEFAKDSIIFLGHCVTADGMTPDPDKIRAILEMPEPTGVEDVRRVMGMANYLGKFLPHLASYSRPIKDLLSEKNEWCWGAPQKEAFHKLKTELSSSRGPDRGRKTLRTEKEALAATWACERLSCYLLGLKFKLETDHKPLVPLLSTKPLDELPPRVLRFRLRLLKFTFDIVHVPVPDRPWQRVGTDLFFWEKKSYLLVVDYFSRYIEVAQLNLASPNTVIAALKEAFSRHGIPETVMSDNGPQYSCALFEDFATEYGFTHVTSSPRYPQANGEAERAVATVKGLWKGGGNKTKALMIYRATPLGNGYSPAQLLMGRQLRTTIPQLPTSLLPHWPNIGGFRQSEKRTKENQQRNYNRRHRALPLPPLQAGQNVWLPREKIQGTLMQPATTPRSYIIQTDEGQVRRNHTHMRTVHHPHSQVPPETPVDTPEPSPESDTFGGHVACAPVSPALLRGAPSVLLDRTRAGGSERPAPDKRGRPTETRPFKGDPPGPDLRPTGCHGDAPGARGPIAWCPLRYPVSRNAWGEKVDVCERVAARCSSTERLWNVMHGSPSILPHSKHRPRAEAGEPASWLEEQQQRDRTLTHAPPI